MFSLSKDSGTESTLRHIAIIMDGNGRWAQKRGLPRIAGHKKGAEVVRGVIESCRENGVPYLTLYAFSSENWSRSTEEVSGLMDLLKFYLGKEIKSLHKNDVKIVFIGDRSKVSEDIKKQIGKAEKLTSKNKSLTLTIALSYGSRDEIVNAAKTIAEDFKDKKISLEDINDELFEKNLYTKYMPCPDVLIRTGGEKRLSNFLLWQLSYTELFFIDILWPDFKKEHITEVISDFKKM